MNRVARPMVFWHIVVAATLAVTVPSGAQVPARAQSQDAVAQDAQPAVPTFRAAVDLLLVDASVVGRGGRPAAGLTPEDFVVEVDGRPRRVVSAALISADAAVGPVMAEDEGVTSNLTSDTGRLIIVAVDQATLPSSARGLVETARRWIAGLTPRDRVGLVSLPPPGPRVEPTSRHQRVVDAIGRVALDTHDSATQTLSGRAVGLWEAAQIADGNERVLREVTDRECAAGPDQWMCTQEVQTDAYTIDAEIRSRSGPVLGNLRSLIEAMGALPGRKDLVLLSGGWVVPDRTNDGPLQDLAGAAAIARVTVHALVADTSALGSVTQTGRRAQFMARDRFLLSNAVESLATMTGGISVRPAGAAAGAFERIGQAMSSYYRLGVEPEERDLDGRRHRLSVKVRPRGLSVGDHRRILTATRAPVDGPLAMDEALDRLLRTPTSVTDVGLRVTSQVVADPDPESLPRVVFGVDLSRASAGYAGVQILISDADGRIVATTAREVDVDASGGASMFAVLGLPPGQYDVRVAARDHGGRVGTVVHAFDTDPAAQGAWRTHGLAIFEYDDADPEPLRPLFGAIAREALLIARVDLVPDGRVSAGQTVPVTFEIAADGASDVLVTEQTVARGTMPGGPLMAESQVPAIELPPGVYTIRARVDSVDTPLTFERRVRIADDVRRVTERLALERRDGRATTAVRPVASASAERIAMAPFSLDAFLQPALVEGITTRAQLVDDAARRASLLTGVEASLTRLRSGQYEAASIALRTVLRDAPDFQPALVLLGACYAAAGAATQAAAVWQTALLADRESASSHSIAIDGWLRADRPASALPLARQAAARWPTDAGFRRQYARALLASGDAAEGVAQLLTVAEPSPADEPLLAAALSQLYRAALVGRPLLDAARDKDAMRTLAARYPPDGPRANLVALWMRGVGEVR